MFNKSFVQTMQRNTLIVVIPQFPSQVLHIESYLMSQMTKRKMMKDASSPFAEARPFSIVGDM